MEKNTAHRSAKKSVADAAYKRNALFHEYEMSMWTVWWTVCGELTIQVDNCRDAVDSVVLYFLTRSIYDMLYRLKTGRRGNTRDKGKRAMKPELILILLFLIACAVTIVGFSLSTARRCSFCQRRVRTRYRYCPHCGSTLSSSESRPNHPRSGLIYQAPPRRTHSARPDRVLPARQARKLQDIPAARQRTASKRSLPLRMTERSHWRDEAEDLAPPLFVQRTPISQITQLWSRSPCPSCNTLVHRTDDYCGQCGTKL